VLNSHPQTSSSGQLRGDRGDYIPFSEVVRHFFSRLEAYEGQPDWEDGDRNALARRFGISPSSVALGNAAAILRTVKEGMPPQTPEELEARRMATRNGADDSARDLARQRSHLYLASLGRAYAQFLLALEQEGSVGQYATFERRLLTEVRPTIVISWIDEDNPSYSLAARDRAFAEGVTAIIPSWETPR
jgi:hypothetical protein